MVSDRHHAKDPSVARGTKGSRLQHVGNPLPPSLRLTGKGGSFRWQVTGGYAMARDPLEEAAYALDYGVSRSNLSLAAQIEYDRLVAAQAQYDRLKVPLTKEERKQAQQQRGEEDRPRLEEWQKLDAETAWFPDMGVAVRDGNVYQHGSDKGGPGRDVLASSERTRRAEMKLLGPLAGAHAEVLSGKTQQRRRSGSDRFGDAVALSMVLGPVGLLAGISRAGTGVALVTLADGNVREKRFTDKPSLLRAQADVVRFNALAASVASTPPEEVAGSGQDGVASELERLVALHASGALDDEEFRAAKSRIIHDG